MKTVSIVICTYNRAPFLRRTLHSLKNLKYKNFEVIVVNGPSDDETESVLEQYKGLIKVGHNPETNLSKSRNIGIKMSAGDIVAFIDDDAIPDEYWLNDIVEMYQDEEVGGAGGKVYGPGDDHFQFENGYVDYWGDADVHVLDSDYNDPNGTKFNMMLGTNCTFLRKALLKVGGFDEYFEYFHDESDLCLRVVKAGYKIKNHKRAYIHHEFAKSHIRENTYDSFRFNWYPIIKNKVYFAMKNSVGYATDVERDIKVNWMRNMHLALYKEWYDTGNITGEEFVKFSKMCNDGFEKGYKDGKELERQFNFSLENEEEFLLYSPDGNGEKYSICLLCKDNIFKTLGGTAKYTYEMAKGFLKLGHDVHVIVQGEQDNDWMEDGISVHSVVPDNNLTIEGLDQYPTTYANVRYSYSVYRKILKLIDKYHIDVVESVLWDFEGLVATRMLKEKLPVLVRLQSPLLKVAETQHWNINEDLKVFADCEKQMMREATGIIAISNHIIETINELYPGAIEDQTIDKVYLGVDTNPCISTRKDDGKVQILYVGRLERRKGIHTIFEILPELMKKHPEVELHFIGNDTAPDEVLGMSYKEYFEKEYQNEPWYSNVKFLGMVDNDVKDQEYADCDFSIAPSLYESFGIIVIEAMSARKTTIGCKIGGMQELIDDGVNGYAIEVENAKELLGRMELLINDKKLREQMGEKAYEKFEELFSNEAMVKNTLTVYKKYIDEMK